ncbi:MAG: hypothetical protein ACK559_13255, partial [bacterium]
PDRCAWRGAGGLVEESLSPLAPQQERRRRLATAEEPDDFRSERLPTTIQVAADAAHLDGQGRVQQQHALARPGVQHPARRRRESGAVGRQHGQDAPQ